MLGYEWSVLRQDVFQSVGELLGNVTDQVLLLTGQTE